MGPHLNKILYIGTDPGGDNILRTLATREPPIKPASGNFLPFHKQLTGLSQAQDYIDGILLAKDNMPRAIYLGTSVNMEIEACVLERFGKLVPIYIVIDEIYDVKSRLQKLGDKLAFVSHIFYITGTPEQEIIDKIAHSIIPHPLIDALRLNPQPFDYSYDKDAPMLIVDEFKPHADTIFGIYKDMYISDIIQKHVGLDGLLVRRHPKQQHLEGHYASGPVSGMIGYSSFYLAICKEMNFSVKTIASPSVNSYALVNYYIECMSINK